jgi:hypothetical protein
LAASSAIVCCMYTAPVCILKSKHLIHITDREVFYMAGGENVLTAKQRDVQLGLLKKRFEENRNRHPEISWEKVCAKLLSHPEKLWSLHEMERTGGEPDVVGYEPETDAYIFYDCAPESPQGRRNVCYDREALASRKRSKPAPTPPRLSAFPPLPFPAPCRPLCPPGFWAGRPGTQTRRAWRIWRCSFCSAPKSTV